MALDEGTKVSELLEKASLDDNDLVVIVDSVTGNNRKVLYATLKDNLLTAVRNAMEGA